MTEQSLETSLETLNIAGHQQPSITNISEDEDFSEILAEFNSFANNTVATFTASLDPNDSNDQLDINALINSSGDCLDPAAVLQTQFSSISFDSNEILDILQSCEKQEPVDYEVPSQQSQSTFIEHYDPSVFYPSQPGMFSAPLVSVGSSPIEPKIEDGVRAYLNQQDELYRMSSKPKKHKGSRSTNVGPVDYVMHSGGCQPCTTVQMQNDYAFQQQQLEYDAAYSKPIQILCQPRSKFRPRTHNESKNSAHYLRCDEGIKPEYPTISIPESWSFHADVNLIEVALMGVDKQAHPYSLDNKASSDTYEDNATIFKQGDRNVLYFRLTKEDFQNGYKTFMMELIKSKQDDVITKELIRTRKLEHSVLRFTRIFQVGKGHFERDEGSTEYSSVMSEAYGDVEVEHMGPRFGPMSGQEMVYVVLKGRILKNDLKIEVIEPSCGWNYNVENFTKNGNVVYFQMPAFPYAHPQCETVKAYVNISYKGDEIFQSPYLYKGSLDRELAELNLNDPYAATASSSMSNTLNPCTFSTETGARPNSSSRRATTTRRPKRLGK